MEGVQGNKGNTSYTDIEYKELYTRSYDRLGEKGY